MSQSAPIFSPVIRPVGIETEFGVLQPGDPYANAVAMASRVVEAYGAVSRPGVMGPDGSRARAVRWDYEAEDPLADLRGGHLDRAAAHPSLLTDDPTHPAPSGDTPADQPDAYADSNSANSSPAVSAGAMTQSTSRRPEHNGGGGEQHCAADLRADGLDNAPRRRGLGLGHGRLPITADNQMIACLIWLGNGETGKRRDRCLPVGLGFVSLVVYAD